MSEPPKSGCSGRAMGVMGVILLCVLAYPFVYFTPLRRGVVTDAVTGKPLEGVIVRGGMGYHDGPSEIPLLHGVACKSEIEFFTTTNSRGEFHFSPRPVIQGWLCHEMPFAVVAYKPGYYNSPGFAEFLANDEPVRNLALRPRDASYNVCSDWDGYLWRFYPKDCGWSRPCQQLREELAKVKKERDAAPCEEGRALVNAGEKGDLAAAKEILEKNPQLLNFQYRAEASLGGTALGKAAEAGHLEMVEFLMRKGADINAPDWKGRTPLFMALTNQHMEIVNLLLDKNADVKGADDEGRTALHLAASGTDPELVKLLIDKGADVNAKDKDGNTALFYCISSAPIAEILLSHGLKVNEKNNRGDSALMVAIDKGATGEIVELFVRYGADVNEKSGSWTILINAAFKKNKDAVSILLAHGADPNVVNDNWLSPLDYVKDYPEILEILIKHGAKSGSEIRKERKTATTPKQRGE